MLLPDGWVFFFHVFLLWEMDARFGEEMKPLNELLDKAVWNTTEDNPTKEWYKKKMNKKYDKDTTQ